MRSNKKIMKKQLGLAKKTHSKNLE